MTTCSRFNSVVICLCLFLLALARCSSAVEAVMQPRLRGRKPASFSSSSPSSSTSTTTSSTTTTTFRITVIDHLIRNEQDGSFSHQDEVIGIPIVDGAETSEYYSIDLPETVLSAYQHLIDNEKLYVSIANPHIEASNAAVTYQDASDVRTLEKSPVTRTATNSKNFRKLDDSSTVEIRRVAVLRVSVTAGPEDQRQVKYSVGEIQSHMFDNAISLKRHIHECSNGKLVIEDAGVHEITVEGQFTDFSNPAGLRNKALDMFAEQLHVGSAHELYDHVIVILPPNTFPGFVGNAGVNHWVSTLNNDWSLDVMVYMHEFGHNLGLNHAFLSDGSADYSSYMSATGTEPNLAGPLKCYNAASNRQLGWFRDRTQKVDIFDNTAQLIPLVAFSEASKFSNGSDGAAAATNPILLEVGNYTLQYNFASEFNKGTEMLQNLVTVAHSEPSRTVVEKDGLEPGLAMFIDKDFAASGQTLKIEACEQIQGTEEAPNTMMVGISLGLAAGSPCDIL